MSWLELGIAVGILVVIAGFIYAGKIMLKSVKDEQDFADFKRKELQKHEEKMDQDVFRK
jgi:hypothetical protein